MQIIQPANVYIADCIIISTFSNHQYILDKRYLALFHQSHFLITKMRKFSLKLQTLCINQILSHSSIAHSNSFSKQSFSLYSLEASS